MKQQVELDIRDFECPLCQILIWEPVTTSCGHTFCKTCIIRALDHSNKCPMCRTILHISPEIGVNIMLQTVIEKAWPEQCEERRLEQEQQKDVEHNLPLFVLDIVLFPNMRLPLHIFEPRYRLMLRRCLEGSRRFGVVPLVGTEIAKVGTTAIIDHHVRLPDGRSLVSTRGGSRFELLDTWEQDGYKLGRVRYLDEKDQEDTQTENAENDEEKTKKLQKKADLFSQAKDAVQAKIGSALTDIQEKFGQMPVDDAQSFSFWLASLLPIPVESKQKLLEMQSTCERLEEEISILSKCRT